MSATPAFFLPFYIPEGTKRTIGSVDEYRWKMPITMARTGEVNSIKRVTGKEEVRRFLESLGFVEGSEVTLLSKNGGNIIVKIRESRVAISKEMANRIMV